jgi:hypothetical protein
MGVLPKSMRVDMRKKTFIFSYKGGNSARLVRRAGVERNNDKQPRRTSLEEVSSGGQKGKNGQRQRDGGKGRVATTT